MARFQYRATTKSRMPQKHLHVLDMFLGYVQKPGLFGHILKICSCREHLSGWPNRVISSRVHEPGRQLRFLQTIAFIRTP